MGVNNNQQVRQRQVEDPVIRHSHLFVLRDIAADKPLDWLGKKVLNSLLNGEIGVCQEVIDLVEQMKKSGKLNG